MSQSKRRGAATIEAILCITGFVLVWAGVLYCGKSYTTQLRQEAVARGCAWTIAVSGCRRIPDGCAAEKRKTRAQGGKSKKLKRFSEKAADSSEIGTEPQGSLDEQVRGLFGERIEASATEEQVKPALLGGGSVMLSAKHQLPCNSVPSTADSLAEVIWETLVKR